MLDDISEFLNDESGTVVIRSFRSKPELMDELSAAIREGKTVAFVPGQRSLRHFFNTQGFISTMDEIARRLEGVEVVIPAGVYGQQHVVGFRPLKQGTQTIDKP